MAPPLTRLGIGRRGLLVASAAVGLGITRSPVRGAFAWQGDVSPTLLVRGEASLGEDAMAWRVVRDVAEPMGQAVFERWALGFVVASSLFGALLLTDEATGSASRLVYGEAAFVREGTFQRRESLGLRAQSYLRIGLVAATAAGDAGGDRLIFAGPAFTASPGAAVLALYRLELGIGMTVPLPPGAGETLLLVEQGEVDLEVGEGAPRERLTTTVGSDTNYAVRSVGPAAMLYGGRDATSVLLATIG